MKALMINLCAYSRTGGMERFNQRIVRSLTEMDGVQARVLSLWDDDCPADLGEHVAYRGFHCNKIPFLLRFIGELLRFRPDAVLVQHVFFAWLHPLICLLCPGAEILLFVHGTEVWDRPSPLFRRLVSLADRIVSVSLYTTSKMAEAYAIPVSRFHLLQNVFELRDFSSDDAVDLEERFPCLFRVNESTVQYRLLTVTRLADRYKGERETILALPAILRRFPDTHYYIVGKGPLASALRDLARKLSVEDHVHLLGAVTDQELAKMYGACDVFVMPSKGEGFGIVYLEAAAHRLPAIAGNVDGSVEAVVDGETGLCVNPDDVPAIATAVIDLLQDPERRRQMGEKGYRRVVESFSHERFHRQFERILCLRGASANAGARHTQPVP
ncbi:glycosyltransferase [Heliobacterium gestii]|uniref:Glycosyltransferase n=1 Tax=Heliomicrobium gestii TaxID=2699 RepID=A0A845LC54_HELGE|nr:glycosyltransferase family 4 protein [Heliomicrobium gestii]MBM7867976.1 glycosyltransferase involved in cell wall biosynthesis [Heliomicrobium gestii]MZP44242.1 glycosyltransferase [Heliomicrobium gestii]